LDFLTETLLWTACDIDVSVFPCYMAFLSEAGSGLGIRKSGMVEHHGILRELWERRDGEVPEGARKLGIDGWSYQVMPVVLWRVESGE
jgi:hypothetical protein